MGSGVAGIIVNVVRLEFAILAAQTALMAMLQRIVGILIQFIVILMADFILAILKRSTAHIASGGIRVSAQAVMTLAYLGVISTGTNICMLPLIN